ncbi:MAG: hypothetical protein HYZ58_05050 [Acidobacteria bacterium]|nr:hypothetical protein [Acidobacteriota bacterium]
MKAGALRRLALLMVVCSVPAFAQESKSAPLAKQLAAALDAAKLDSIAAKDPATPGVYCAALYIPGLEFLAISGRYSVPQLLDERLTKKEYRDIYLDLNGAAEAKVFIEDLGMDGLKLRPDNQAPDSYEAEGKRTVFDNAPKKHKLTDEEYGKTFSDADRRYANILTLLLAQLQKSS